MTNPQPRHPSLQTPARPRPSKKFVLKGCGFSRAEASVLEGSGRARVRACPSRSRRVPLGLRKYIRASAPEVSSSLSRNRAAKSMSASRAGEPGYILCESMAAAYTLVRRNNIKRQKANRRNRMTRREKEVLNTITQVLENLTTRPAALEGALVRGGTLATGLRQQLEPDYVAAAKTELAALRTSISVLPIQGGPAL
jgi:hypothetical protein